MEPHPPITEPAPKVQLVRRSLVSDEIPLVLGMSIADHGRLHDGETVLKLTRQGNNSNIYNDEPFMVWVPEHALQDLDAEAVYEYWENLPGGRDYQLGYMHKWAANLRSGRDEQHNVKWEIFKIRDCRLRGGEMDMLVHWQGYREEESSWIAERDLAQQAPEAVAFFWKQHNDPTRVEPKKKIQGSLSRG
ncbi:chromo domain-containing protein [Colletotrichum incanum]|uniref:Chromo domain-containing protein n=1 Tax=Colletotrichum incanum TaxID=1573173 RepID=A0A161XSE4_COLIC|nr:chromo domain-containing protein [Colletotrichum incanum]